MDACCLSRVPVVLHDAGLRCGQPGDHFGVPEVREVSTRSSPPGTGPDEPVPYSLTPKAEVELFLMSVQGTGDD